MAIVTRVPLSLARRVLARRDSLHARFLHARSQHAGRRGLVGVFGATCALTMVGCGHDATGPSHSNVYRRLQLNHHAITMATVVPYDTLQLAVTPYDLSGNPIEIPPTARTIYTVSDTSLVVDSSGLLHVHWSGSDLQNLQIIARLSLGEGVQALTVTDTAFVNITNAASTSDVPTLDSLIFRPVAGDSARRAATLVYPLTTQDFDSVVARAADGSHIPNAIVRYRASDSSIASFATPTSMGTPEITPMAPGVTLLTAEATVYGKRRVDSVWYTVGYPLQGEYDYGYAGTGYNSGTVVALTTLSNVLSLGTVEIGLGGAVLWRNSMRNVTDDLLDVQFDDPSQALGLPVATGFPNFFIGTITIPPGPGGNIDPFPAAVVEIDSSTPYSADNSYFKFLYDSTTSKARTFPGPGRYHWTSRHQGISGTVIVVPNDSLQTPASLRQSLSRSLSRAR